MPTDTEATHARDVEGWLAETLIEGKRIVALAQQTHRLLRANNLRVNIEEAGTTLEQMLLACDRLCATSPRFSRVRTADWATAYVTVAARAMSGIASGMSA